MEEGRGEFDEGQGGSLSPGPVREQTIREYQRRCEMKSDIAGHLPHLYKTVCQYEKAQVIELGVRRGHSTSALLAAVYEVDGHLWSCDVKSIVRTGSLVPEWWHGLDRWTLHIGRSLGPRALVQAPEKCDVLFLDASHAETLKELEAYVPRVQPGGVVFCHDTDNPLFDGEVSDAMDKYFGDWENRPGWEGMGVAVID